MSRTPCLAADSLGDLPRRAALRPDGSEPFRVTNVAEIPSPAILLFRARIEENLRRMIAVAEDPARLRPHIKTHKIAELVRRQIELGISRFKCATIAEAELAATAGARDVLLAYQPVGPDARRWVELHRAYPDVRWKAIVDDPAAVAHLVALAGSKTLELLVDLDIGQHRTGVPPGAPAMELARALSKTAGVAFGGLHAYDGHLHQPDAKVREVACREAFAPVDTLRDALLAQGIAVPRVVAGGTPTFPFHARRGDLECSPGTCVLWDAGYRAKLPDLDFLPAAILLTRVVSRPGPNRLCFDLGHKAVASEMPHPRVMFPDLPDAIPVAHNEEHLVLETPLAERFPVGSVAYGIPWHVCPTMALHAEAWVVDGSQATERWAVAARARRLRI
ncbi:MAG: D-TA family PLP-dependent enzyme [Verrucomicrobiales bacterium]|nr:D-TA family PLP-dependent enzyme [Verrucomicrobiales bacterium]